MSLRDDVKDWLKEGKEIKAKNPLCSKRLVVDNLLEVYGLLEDGFIDLTKEKIEVLIENIKHFEIRNYWLPSAEAHAKQEWWNSGGKLSFFIF